MSACARTLVPSKNSSLPRTSPTCWHRSTTYSKKRVKRGSPNRSRDHTRHCPYWYEHPAHRGDRGHRPDSSPVRAAVPLSGDDEHAPVRAGLYRPACARCRATDSGGRHQLGGCAPASVRLPPFRLGGRGLAGRVSVGGHVRHPAIRPGGRRCLSSRHLVNCPCRSPCP